MGNSCCNKKTHKLKEVNNISERNRDILTDSRGNQLKFKQDDFEELLKNKMNIIDMYNSTIKTPVNFDIFGLNKLKEEELTIVTSHKKEYKFNVISLLGSGSFGKVYLVRFQENNTVYAMKVIEKHTIKIRDCQDQTMRERFLLEKINSPFVVKLEFAFQSKENLFLITEFGQGGELYYHMMINKCFEERRVQQYMSELVLALEALHNNGCVYRDLKPDNILIDKDGHIKITDFGLSKIDLKNEKSFSIVGTAGYFAPEILFKPHYDHRVDYWSLGVIMYEMIEGCHPFEYLKKINPNKKNQQKLNQLVDQKPVFTDKFSQEAKDLCSYLLCFDAEQRPKISNDIKKHPFFKYYDLENNELFDWDKALNKQYIPNFVPELRDSVDTRYFHRFYTEQNTESLIFKENNKNKDSIGNLDSIQEDKSMSNNKIQDQSNDYYDFTYINSVIGKNTSGGTLINMNK